MTLKEKIREIVKKTSCIFVYEVDCNNCLHPEQCRGNVEDALSQILKAIEESLPKEKGIATFETDRDERFYKNTENEGFNQALKEVKEGLK